MDDSRRSEDLERLSTLTDPVRRRLYAMVAGEDEPVTRDAAAAAVGISRTLAAYHLDRLVAAGLLHATHARPAGVGGSGAGRPPKRYGRAGEEFSVSVPPRRYDLLAALFATAIAADTEGGVRRSLRRAARDEGHAIGTAGEDLHEALTTRGYEPIVAANGDIDLRNCPFDRLARPDRGFVCEVNYEMLQALLEAREDDPARAELCPREGRCCVLIRSPHT